MAKKRKKNPKAAHPIVYYRLPRPGEQRNDAVITTSKGPVYIEAKNISRTHPDDDHVLPNYSFLRFTEPQPTYIRSRKFVRVKTVVCTWSAFLPQRVNDEELGDYLEDINNRVAEGQSRWVIYTRVFAAIFWTAVNTVGYFLREVGKTKSAN